MKSSTASQPNSWGGHGVGWVEATAIDEVLEHSPAADSLHVLVLHVVLCYRGENGRMNPSVEKLAKRCRTSERTIKRRLADLKHWQLLDWQPGGIRGQQKISNSYVIGKNLRRALDTFYFIDPASVGHNDGPQEQSSVGQPCGPQDTEDSYPAPVGQNDVFSVGHETDSSVGHEPSPSVGHPDGLGSNAFEAIPRSNTKHTGRAPKNALAGDSATALFLQCWNKAETKIAEEVWDFTWQCENDPDLRRQKVKAATTHFSEIERLRRTGQELTLGRTSPMIQ